MNILELEGISKKYDQEEILRNVNLKIKKGANLGLIGPTGCGKTTLLRIIDLLENPDSGKIIFNDTDVLNSSKKEKIKLRRKIGMVFQKPVVFRGTVMENVAYGPDIRGRDKNALKGKISEKLESLGLGGYEDRDASSLSGGETQRMALARVLINEPELLVLDEPTANLDPLSTEKIESIILELKKKETTVIMATHDLIQGQRLCEEIAILNHEIYQIGSPEDVFSKPKNRFVADFVGVKNIIHGHAEAASEGLSAIKTDSLTIYSSESLNGPVHVSIRPEDITISLNKVETSALNEFKGKVTDISKQGALVNVKIKVSTEIFMVYMTRKSFLDMELNLGSPVWVQFKASAVHVFR
jgi:tungstate transport system ATP-binding protein